MGTLFQKQQSVIKTVVKEENGLAESVINVCKVRTMSVNFERSERERSARYLVKRARQMAFRFRKPISQKKIEFFHLLEYFNEINGRRSLQIKSKRVLLHIKDYVQAHVQAD